MYQDRYWCSEYFAAVEGLKQIARTSGRSLISLALNWLLHHTATDCVILGSTRTHQLDENLAMCKEGPLPPEVLQSCDEIWRRLRGPAPIYNR